MGYDCDHDGMLIANKLCSKCHPVLHGIGVAIMIVVGLAVFVPLLIGLPVMAVSLFAMGHIFAGLAFGFLSLAFTSMWLMAFSIDRWSSVACWSLFLAVVCLSGHWCNWVAPIVLVVGIFAHLGVKAEDEQK